jgi:hypothetical protein
VAIEEWQIVCKVVMVLHTKSSTTDLSFKKSVPVPEQLAMLHKQTHLDICQHLDRYGNEREAFLESSLVTKYGCIIASRRVNIHNRPVRKS